jgi:hypothetical protein
VSERTGFDSSAVRAAAAASACSGSEGTGDLAGGAGAAVLSDVCALVEMEPASEIGMCADTFELKTESKPVSGGVRLPPV